MAAQTPFFMSGPRLLLKIDGVKVAYAVGLDLRVSRNVQIVNTLGSFASVAIQATMYNGVSGSMQIVRLLDSDSRGKLVDAANAAGKQKKDPALSALPEAALTGLNTPDVNTQSSSSNSLITATENLKKHLDPASVLASSTFDIEVWQMYPTVGTVAGKESKLNNKGVLVKHFTVQNCRLNSRSASISAGQLLTESFSFTGTLLVSEDRADGAARDEADLSGFGSAV
jgi:hypothetical protein